MSTTAKAMKDLRDIDRLMDGIIRQRDDLQLKLANADRLRRLVHEYERDNQTVKFA